MGTIALLSIPATPAILLFAASNKVTFIQAHLSLVPVAFALFPAIFWRRRYL